MLNNRCSSNLQTTRNRHRSPTKVV